MPVKDIIEVRTLKELYECQEEIEVGNGKIPPSLMRQAVRHNYRLNDIGLETLVRISTVYNPEKGETPIYLGQIAHIRHDDFQNVWLYIE